LPRWFRIYETYNLSIEPTNSWNHVSTRLVSLPGNGPRELLIRAHWCDGTEQNRWTF
jgi:hypothetical protein